MSQYPAPPPPYGQPQQDHPQATTILILGICALVLCQILGPFAWSMGNRALREIDASQGSASPLGGRDTVNVGRILGMVSTILLALAIVVLLLVVVLAVVGLSTSP
jgi:hypothetical protein